MTAAEHRQPASVYTDSERAEQEREVVRRAPQLVGYRSELPEPGSYCTKTVLDVPILLTRDADGQVHAFQNICAHRAAPVATGCGTAERFVCPFHAWTYDNHGRFVGGPGREGFPTALAPGVGLTELPAAEYAGFLWLSLVPLDGPLDIAAHLGDLGPELASWNVGSWSHVGEKTLDAPVNWKLALDTFAENYHFATVHRDSFGTFARSNCALFDSYGPHHRLVFPLRNITDIADQPEDSWQPLNHLVVIYALFPNIVLSCTVANGEIFRVYPGQTPGQSVTYHDNATLMDISDEMMRIGVGEIFEYAHSSVRDEDYSLAADIQRALASGARDALVFGRNEPGLHHRHAAVDAALTNTVLADTLGA